MRRIAAAVVLTAGLALLGPAGSPAWASAGATSPRTPSAGTRAATPGSGAGWLTGRRQRLLAVWILVDVGGLMLWYGAAPTRAPRLLGSVGAHRAGPAGQEPDPEELPVRGIGRFARPRSGPPGRLL